MRPILITGGAPRVAVDAVRYLSVATTGATAVRLADLLARRGCAADLLLGLDAAPGVPAQRFTDREDLERSLRGWIADHAEGLVVMSAAVNDYTVAGIEAVRDGRATPIPAGAKAASGAEELIIRLRPAGKLIDRFREWGLSGPVVGFKYEDAATVVASARALRNRAGAALVVANSLCGTVLALVGDTVEPCTDRADLLDRLATRLADLAH